jgi:hypothetical protein
LRKTVSLSRRLEGPIQWLQKIFTVIAVRSARSAAAAPQTTPSLLAARSLMAEASLVDAVAKALKKSPPLTPAVRERINALLDGAS